VQHSFNRPSVVRRRRSVRSRETFGAAQLALWCLAAVFFACTLTDGEFHPEIVDPEPNLPAPSDCGPGVACCTGTPCAGGRVCREGVCQEAQPAPSGGASGCAGSECVPDALSPPEPTCDDGLLGPDETDVDCGGVCGRGCDVGLRCAGDEDCAAGLLCPPESGRCAAASCADGLQGGAEVDVDCGGGSCPGCPDGTACNTGSDCSSGVCDESGRCAAPSCTDAVTNGREADVDCGGACAGCEPGRACGEATDCQSGVCGERECAAGLASCCQRPACDDSVANGDETDVDCGGSCGECATGQACDAAGDCESQSCRAGGCGAGVERCCQAASCVDGVRNGAEIDVDCGGGCGLCPLSARCAQDNQCESDFCEAGLCADPGTCNDGVRNGRESSVDCGGDRCPLCADQSPCNQASDCVNDNCFEGVCISCGSGVIDGTETDVDCGGSDPFCRRCLFGERCLVGSDCASGFCNNGFC
jgi:hypothetical protein